MMLLLLQLVLLLLQRLGAEVVAAEVVAEVGRGTARHGEVAWLTGLRVHHHYQAMHYYIQI